MIQIEEWRIILNNTLLNHFDGICDENYILLKQKVIENLNMCNVIKDEIEAFKTVEQSAEILDYLITYIRNIIRMGFSDDKLNVELDVLYDYDDKNQMILNQMLPKLKIILEQGKSDILNDYNFFFKRISAEHTDFSVDCLPEYKDISFVLEHYQNAISKQVDGKESIADLFLLYQVSDNLSRKDMRDGLLREIQNLEESITHLFWFVKNYQNTLSKSYNFDSPLEYIAKKYCISCKTVESVYAQTKKCKQKVSEFNNRFEEFGLKNQNIIYLTMSLPKLNVINFSFSEAMKLLEDCFMALDTDFGKMVHKAKLEEWIDWEKRPGKLNGSYTNIIPFCKKSIISMSFDGSISDVCKLAHELGHAFHGICVSDHSFFNTDFSVITAEMFGLFCENYALIFLAKKFMKSEYKKKWKDEFYFNALRTYYSNLIAFHFEKRSFDSLKDVSISPTEIYRDTLFCLGLKQNDDIEEYGWMFRSQNFFPDYFYYNFVYIIGEAVSLSLIEMLMKEKIDFKSIREVLNQSGVDNVDNLFSIINQDLHSEEIYDIINTLDRIWYDF